MVMVAEGSATEDWKEKGLEEVVAEVVVAEVVVAGVRVEAELQARSPGCKRVLREEVQGRKSQKVQQSENIRLVTSSGWCSAKKGRFQSIRKNGCVCCALVGALLLCARKRQQNHPF